MSDQEYIVECIVEHIMCMEHIDMLRDLGEDVSMFDIDMLGRVELIIKENRLLEYK